MLMFIWLFTLAALIVSFQKDKKRTLQSLDKSFMSIKNMAPGLFAMITLIGLILAAVPKETLIGVFTVDGVWGFVLVSLVGAVVTIPGPIAFPLAGALLNMGAAPAVLASFITTMTMVGLVSSPLEMSFFGFRFTVLRQTFSLIAAIAIGLIMGWFL